MDEKGDGAMGLVAACDGDGLTNGREADILQDLDGIMGGLFLEDGKADLFLHNVDGNLSAGFRNAFRKCLFDLRSAIGAANSANLNGVDSGASALMYLRHE